MMLLIIFPTQHYTTTRKGDEGGVGREATDSRVCNGEKSPRCLLLVACCMAAGVHDGPVRRNSACAASLTLTDGGVGFKKQLAIPKSTAQAG
jgi:hypothetical protein